MIYYESSERFVISEWTISHRLLIFSTNRRPAPGVVNDVLIFSLADYVEAAFRLYGVVIEDANDSEVATLKTRLMTYRPSTELDNRQEGEQLAFVRPPVNRHEYKYFALRTQDKSYYVVAMGFSHRVHTGQPFVRALKLGQYLVKREADEG